MKKIIYGWLIVAVLMLWSSMSRSEDLTSYTKRLATAVTNIVANSTNQTAGTTFQLYNAVRTPIRLYVTGEGNSATTNGNLIIKFSTAAGTPNSTNTFDTAALSNIKLTLSATGSTNTVSDWFTIGGGYYLRVGQIENTSNGSFSNIVVRAGF